MLFPVKVKLAPFEAEAFRKYMQRMLAISAAPEARVEVILLAEYYPRLETLCRAKLFSNSRKVSTYTIPLSVALILWVRWQKEPSDEVIQMLLAKIDYQLNAIDRRPHFPKTIL